MTSGPYLPTSAAYLKESSLLLQAYPDSTRITTKYTFPKAKPSSKSQAQNSTQEKVQAQPPLATLVLKTFNPEAGICLKYRTNKAAEVGRLITALGLLAGGADLTSLDSAAAVSVPGTVGDVEMGGVEEVVTAAATPATAIANAGTGAGGKGKSKKKGKGKK